MHDKFQHYRQPMVTATSIFLGFMLNVGYNWGGHAFESRRLKDGFVAKGNRKPICAPAPSLDRLEIFYNKFDSIIISP